LRAARFAAMVTFELFVIASAAAIASERIEITVQLRK